MRYLFASLALVCASAAGAADADQFRRELLSARSATAILQKNCPIDGASIRAEQVEGAQAALPPGLRDALMLGSHEIVRHRRVRLMCGPMVFSEADNWYVPDRLTPAMNATLQDSQTPFGRVVAPLNPDRKTLKVESLAGPAFLEVTAVLIAENGRPISGVIETYQRSVLGPADPVGHLMSPGTRR